VQLATFNWAAGLPTEWRWPPRPFESRLEAALNGGPVAEAGMGPGLRPWIYWPTNTNGLEHSEERSCPKQSTTLPCTIRLSWSVIEAATVRSIPAWGEGPRRGLEPNRGGDWQKNDGGVDVRQSGKQWCVRGAIFSGTIFSRKILLPSMFVGRVFLRLGIAI
ncbi:MAG TPA: hypothetical protein PLW35_09075, partial [Verrucomicrobiota bacterium]|nr:hypothetical protein [Verrucomicrobiota bacterium]